MDAFIRVREVAQQMLRAADTRIIKYHFDGTKDGGGCPPNDSENVTKSCVWDEYSVARDSDISVEFDTAIASSYEGRISIRARVLRSTPVELPVDNYTIVNEDKLQQQFEMALDPDGVRRKREGQMSALRSSAIRVAVLAARLTSQVHELARVIGQPKQAADAGTAKKGAAVASPPEQPEDGGLAFSALATSYPSNWAGMGDAEKRIEREIVAGLIAEIVKTRAQILTELSAADAALKQLGLGSVAQAPSAQERIVTLLTLLDSAQRQLARELPLVRCEDKTCIDSTWPPLVDAVAQSQNVARELTDGLAHDGLVDKVAESLLDYHDEPHSALRPGVVHLSDVRLAHGERVEVVVTSTFASASARQEDEPEKIVLRFRFRVVDRGFSWRIAPQVVLATRQSDVLSPTASEVPSYFQPAVGAAFTVRYRTRGEWSDWVLPSVGMGAALLNFDPRTSYELGVGLQVGLLNENIHFGYGWNLAVRENSGYFYVGLDFLRGIETFGSFFDRSGVK